MDVDTTEDLHGIVLNSAFKAMIANPSKVLVNTKDNTEISLNRNVLILFSPVIRNIFATVPCCTTPTIYLPDISTNTVIKLRDILNRGVSGDFWDVTESGDILDAAQVLGIDIRKLHYGEERTGAASGEIIVNIGNIRNKSKHMKKVFDQKKFEGKDVVLVKSVSAKRPASGASDPVADISSLAPPTLEERAVISNIAVDNANSSEDTVEQAKVGQTQKSVPGPSSVATSSSADISSTIKEPAHVASVPSNHQIKEEMHPEEDITDGLEAAKEPVSTDEASVASANEGPNDTDDLKNQCEKCKKPFASITLLRYHYCSHFRGILKKKFANLFHDNKCLECFKTFNNPGRLLLHIGVQHDKINDILRSKGITELPPFSVTAAMGGEEASGQNNKQTQEIMQPKIPPMGDVKNIPLINTKVELGKITSTETTLPTNISQLDESLTVSNQSMETTPTEDTSAAEKINDTSECNYELECQVCDQKLKTVSLLEQHCCRHFMKELQDQYGSLMDGLKCNICYNTFKQKHSLLLHIGCKHGKINDILKQKNFAALPCPVTNTSSAAMQKQLIQIKKERMELKEEDYNNVRNEMMEEEDIPNEKSNVSVNVAPLPSLPISEEAAPAFTTTLDEILKKYRFNESK